MRVLSALQDGQVPLSDTHLLHLPDTLGGRHLQGKWLHHIPSKYREFRQSIRKMDFLPQSCSSMQIPDFRRGLQCLSFFYAF